MHLCSQISRHLPSAQLDEGHVAVLRCDPIYWKDHCWLEFHWCVRAQSSHLLVVASFAPLGGCYGCIFLTSLHTSARRYDADIDAEWCVNTFKTKARVLFDLFVNSAGFLQEIIEKAIAWFEAKRDALSAGVRKKTGTHVMENPFRIPLDKPAVFLANCPAVVTRTHEDDKDNHGKNQLEYSVPMYSEG